MNKTILVVEDEQALQEALKFKLEKAGLTVITASTGEEALAILGKQVPNLVSLDILLPRMNGLEVLRTMRQNDSLKDVPVVMVSVSGGPEKVKQAFGFNVVDYLVKSEYTIDDIVKKLLEIMKSLS